MRNASRKDQLRRPSYRADRKPQVGVAIRSEDHSQRRTEDREPLDVVRLAESGTPVPASLHNSSNAYPVCLALELSRLKNDVDCIRPMAVRLASILETGLVIMSEADPLGLS